MKKASILKILSSGLFALLLIPACPTPLEKDKLTVLQDLTPPVITIESPLPDSEFQSVLTVRGRVIDRDGENRPLAGVRFLNYRIANYDTEDTPLELDREGNFSVTLGTADFKKTLTLIFTAGDLNGNRAELSLSLNPDKQGPHMEITSPQPYTVFKTGLTVTGRVSDSEENDTLDEVAREISYDFPGTSLSGTADVDGETGSFSFSIDTSDYDKQLICRVRARDLNGNETEASLTLIPDTTGPWLEITSPGDYSLYKTTLTVMGRVKNSSDDAALDEVAEEISYDFPGTSLSGTAEIDRETGEFSFAVDTADLENQLLCRVTAFDRGGNGTTELINILPDREGPYLTLSYPENYSTFKSVTTFSGTVTNGPEDASTNEVQPVVSYEFPGTPIRGTAEINSNTGRFGFSVPTVSYKSQLLCIITARDDRNNQTTLQITLNPDLIGPYLVVTSPEDFSEYATQINLEGYVYNSESDRTTSELNRVLHYGISGTGISGTTTINGSDGSFAATVDMSEWEGTKALVVTAYDTCNNGTSETLTLNKPSGGGDISGFSVVPANKSVTVTWEDVPGAASYSLYESSYGQSRTDITSPYVWDGLENGEIYRFRLTAHMEDSAIRNGESELITKMPLSRLSLCPRKTNDASKRTIKIEWPRYGTIDDYVVERSRAPDGPWSVRRVLSQQDYEAEGGFIDTDVDHGEIYYYRIRPLEFDDIASYSCSAVPERFGAPVVLAEEDTDGSAYDVALSGDYAFVADSSGLIIVDISDPEHPETRASVDTPNSARGICLSGTKAYVADYFGGLVIIDVSDPENPGEPVQVDSPDKIDYAYDVAISGDYAFVADGSNGLAVYDLTDLSRPPVYRDTEGHANGVEILGDTAYVADGYKLAVIDVTDPMSPGWPDYKDMLGSGYAQAITVRGDYAFVANGGKLSIIDRQNLAAPSVDLELEGYAYDLYLDDCYAYLACDSKGVAMVDISDPTAPHLLRYIRTSGDARGIKGDGAFLAGACLTKGLSMIDAASPMNPSEGQIHDAHYIQGMDWEGGYLFMANNDKGLAVLDVNDPSLPGGTSEKIWDGFAMEVDVYGDFAFLACHSAGLGIVDISDPANPGDPLIMETGGVAYDIVVFGDYAYLANDAGGLAIIDISDPAAPLLKTPVTTSDGAKGVCYDDGYAYLAIDLAGLAVVDVSDSENPGSAAEQVSDNRGNRVDVMGDYAFLAMNSGLAVMDISLPEDPEESLFLPTPDYVRDITLQGTHAYMARYGEGFAVMDVTDPLSPGGSVLRDTDPVTSTAVKSVVSGRYAFVSDGGELVIFDLLGGS